MTSGIRAAIVVSLSAGVLSAGCKPVEPNELDKLPTVTISIKGKPFRLWIADQPGEQERGLMYVTADQMKPLDDGTQRGMLFVFDHEALRYFWMKNTIIPLDIAYLDTTGTVVSTHTMAPLDDRLGQYPSGAPVRLVIEVSGGVWSGLGLEPGDHVDIPSSVLNHAP